MKDCADIFNQVSGCWAAGLPCAEKPCMQTAAATGVRAAVRLCQSRPVWPPPAARFARASAEAALPRATCAVKGHKGLLACVAWQCCGTACCCVAKKRSPPAVHANTAVHYTLCHRPLAALGHPGYTGAVSPCAGAERGRKDRSDRSRRTGLLRRCSRFSRAAAAAGPGPPPLPPRAAPAGAACRARRCAARPRARLSGAGRFVLALAFG